TMLRNHRRRVYRSTLGYIPYSPACTHIAVYRLDHDGKIDIYTLNLKDADPHVRRLTDDLYSERDLSWGDEGIVYAGDATESGRYNPSRIDPVDGTPTRLTDAPVAPRSPAPRTGRAVLTASDAG